MPDAWVDVRDLAGRLLHREPLEVDPATRAEVLLRRWLQTADACNDIDAGCPLVGDTRAWLQRQQQAVRR